MMKNFFRTLLRSHITKAGKTKMPFGKPRQFTHERLESRLMMTVNPTGAEFLANDFTAGFQGTTEGTSAVAVSEAAGTLTVYTGRGTDSINGVYLSRGGQDGTDAEVVRASTTLQGERTAATVAANAAGDTVVVWQGRGVGDRNGIFLRRFDAAGVPQGDEQLVNTTIGGSQESPAVAIAADGSFVVTWSGPSGEDSQGIFAQRFNADGTADGDEVLVNTTVADIQNDPAIDITSGGDYVITWTSQNQDGEALGIFAQRFDATGAPQGDEFQVNTTTAGSQRESSVAVREDGSFFVVWTSVGQDGDNTGIFGQLFDATGAAVGDETAINTTTAGRQQNAQIAANGDGFYVVWQSGVLSAGGWEVAGQELDADGNLIDTEDTLNSLISGLNSGHQWNASIAFDASGNGAVVWSGFGTTDRNGVFARSLLDDGAGAEPNLTPDLATIPDQTAEPGTELEVNLTATDPNAGDTLTFELDPTGSPANATIEQTSNTTAIIRFTPTNDQGNTVVDFRVLVTDNGEPPLADAEEFQVNVSAGTAIDLNGPAAAGEDSTAQFIVGNGEAVIADENLAVTTATGGQIQSATIVITDSLDFSELLNVDTSGTSLTEDFDVLSNTLTITGAGSAEDYQNVLRTLTYSNTGPALGPNAGQVTGDSRTITVVINDGTNDSNTATIALSFETVALDLNGPGAAGVNSTAQFITGGGETVIADSNLTVNAASDLVLQSATISLTNATDGPAEVLNVDTTGTSLTANFDTTTGILSITGDGSPEDYQNVLRTLAYNNTGDVTGDSRTVTIQVSDGTDISNLASLELELGEVDLVSLAQELSAAGAQLFGAFESANSTAQRQLFQDGDPFLPFVPVTDSTGALNQTAIDNNITDADTPTWIFADGTRLEGEQTLEALAAQAGVDIPLANTPFIAEVTEDTLLIGSPLHVSLDGFDPNGGPLTYTVTTDNPGVSARILEGNRSARFNIAGYGDLVFELFEQRASRATDRVIELAEADFYDGIIFHRIIDDFVIQGGDPTGIGNGGSGVDVNGDFDGTPGPNFDDQFNVELQHNRSGLLSFAKAGDDTNDSQFFITDFTDAQSQQSLRNLDFNHTVFGVQTEGDAIRDAINNVATNGFPNDRPLTDVVIEDVEIFTDTENAVLFLEADPGTTGDVTVTVTVTDEQGNSFDREFTLAVEEDTFNNRPFLDEITGPVVNPADTVAQIQLGATDVEGDAFFFEAERTTNAFGVEIPQPDFDFTIDSNTGLLEVTPPAGFVGTLQLTASVVSTLGASDPDEQVIEFVFV